jgi:hypothetical protein
MRIWMTENERRCAISAPNCRAGCGDEVFRHSGEADDGGDKIICSRGETICGEVGVIRGGGEASDAKRMADQQSGKIGAASNTRDQDDPPV